MSRELMAMRMVLMILLFAAGLAQQQPGAMSGRKTSAPATASQQPASATNESGLSSPTFNDGVAQAIMQKLEDGLKTHSISKTRSLFDFPKFGPGFLGNMIAAFNHYDRFEPFYRIEQISGEGMKGTITAQFDMDEQAVESTFDSGRRHALLTLTVARVPVSSGKQEWRITAMQPPDFLFHF